LKTGRPKSEPGPRTEMDETNYRGEKMEDGDVFRLTSLTEYIQLLCEDDT
jgi:hypothetical protein